MVLDIYDLKEGDDKYAFMERMVTDKSVTHVLVVCDSKYAEKAVLSQTGFMGTIFPKSASFRYSYAAIA